MCIRWEDLTIKEENKYEITFILSNVLHGAETLLRI
jgi:hypothetical protein